MAADVVLASNRGPVSFTRSTEGFGMKRGAGGLAGALDPVARNLGDKSLWIAAAGAPADRAALAAGKVEQARDALGYPLHLIDIEPAMYTSYYDRVSNRMLWFANHCLFDEVGIGSFDDADIADWNGAYIAVNEMFADEIAARSNPSSFVLVQDYHLSLVPQFLRSRGGERTIAHFTHSSFCGPDALARLPQPIAAQLIEGLLGADLVGFHVPEWASCFLACCSEAGAIVDHRLGAVDYQGRRTWVRTYPIPIDCAALKERASSESATGWIARLRRDDRILIVRADRAEPSKNIVRGFDAFGALLDRRPDLRQAVRFVACIYPSRESMPEYQAYNQRVQEAVNRVNQRHPGSIELHDSDNFDRTLGALTTYDVLLVNPIMDGMNLVSKEGACLNQRGGTLVLSRRAGSFLELGEHAVCIDDPLDIAETADALETAIFIPPNDRQQRATALREIVTRSRPTAWIEHQLEDLRAILETGRPVTQAP